MKKLPRIARMKQMPQIVIPAEAGIRSLQSFWIPVFTGMTCIRDIRPLV